MDGRGFRGNDKVRLSIVCNASVLAVLTVGGFMVEAREFIS